ncbi:hypothetical protein [Methanolapillus millepedarum]|uniref:Uncharacterized protein n=1 Tax=Methanolapillus millepedarum TaxID=3028296 RepID=A0AA96ZU24_9EURY|nr:hypothetical protein MsAc7_07010 [Methanosarcinaceae archaeon Ac7]
MSEEIVNLCVRCEKKEAEWVCLECMEEKQYCEDCAAVVGYQCSECEEALENW